MLLTSAAVFLHADPGKFVKRWPLAGDPHGIAVGSDGTVYVGLAQPQAVVAIDPATGATKRKVVLDSPDIASTKELVTLRTDARATRLYIANGSDESATILALPDMHVLREITIEGEAIRDAVPDPQGRYLYLLGRRVHVYDFDGEHELHTIAIDDPTAIAASPKHVAIFNRNGVTMFDTTNFAAGSRMSLSATIQAAIFAGNTLFAASRNTLFYISGNTVLRETGCLPAGSGPQIATLGHETFLAERRCDAHTYALAFDPAQSVLYATERAGYLTIYRVPK